MELQPSAECDICAAIPFASSDGNVEPPTPMPSSAVYGPHRHIVVLVYHCFLPLPATAAPSTRVSSGGET